MKGQMDTQTGRQTDRQTDLWRVRGHRITVQEWAQCTSDRVMGKARGGREEGMDKETDAVRYTASNSSLTNNFRQLSANTTGEEAAQQTAAILP